MTEEVIYSDDYTRLARHENRSFTLGDASLAAIGGVAWAAAGLALQRSAKVWLPALITPVAVVFWLLGVSPFLALLLLPIPVVVEYIRASKERRGGLSRSEELDLARKAKGFPRQLLGFGADTEPREIHWHVIFYVPSR